MGEQDDVRIERDACCDEIEIVAGRSKRSRAMSERPTNVRDLDGWTDLVELDEHGQGLTQWEIDFVESLMQQLRGGRTLSQAQRVKLEAIREERL